MARTPGQIDTHPTDADEHCSPAFERSLEAFHIFQNVECGLSPNTIAAYRHDLRRLGDFLRRRSIETWDQITPQIIQKHLVEMTDRGYCETTLARHTVAVRMWLCQSSRAPGAKMRSRSQRPASGLPTIPPASRLRWCLKCSAARCPSW